MDCRGWQWSRRNWHDAWPSLAQAQLVQAMLLAGEAGLAMEFAAMLQLPASVMHIDPSVLTEQALHRASAYLQMPLPWTSMLQETPSLVLLLCISSHTCASLHVACYMLRAQVVCTGVHLVETEEQILPAIDMLSNSRVLGVDCEWEPKFEASFGLGVDSSPISILQVRLADGSPVI